MPGRVALIALLFAILSSIGCSRRVRPTVVPESAVWSDSAKTGYWKTCSFSYDEQVHCVTWNESGTVLINERFLPLDGKPGPVLAELLIRGEDCSGPYRVCLVNGRILVPESMVDRMGATQGNR